MQVGRAILVAIAVAGLLLGPRAGALAQGSAGDSGARQPADKAAADPTQTEGSAPKPAEGTPKPPEAPAKPVEGANQNPGQKPGGRPAEKSAQQPVPEPRLVSILGRDVTNREGDAGRVIDVLVDHDGHLGAVVVEFGGFMGIGSRKVAVDWRALRFRHEGNHTSVVVDISREQIRDAGEYKPNEPAVLTPK